MMKILENKIFRCFLSSLLFGVIYFFMYLITGDQVEFDKLLISMALYFIIMCLLHLIAPKLRKALGHDKNNTK